MDLEKLGAPTPRSAVKERPGPGGTKLSYIDARDVYVRLDEAVGVGNWQTTLERMEKGWLAGIGIYVDGQWVWKHDYGEDSGAKDDIRIKGGASDAIKRAAVQWGIGRDLYGDDAPKPSRWDDEQIAAAESELPPDHDPVGFLDASGLAPVHGAADIKKFTKAYANAYAQDNHDKKSALKYAKDNWKK